MYHNVDSQIRNKKGSANFNYYFLFMKIRNTNLKIWSRVKIVK